MATWSQLEESAPDLAAFGADRLSTGVAYLSTIRADGRPRVHPVTPIIADGRLFVFMEPTSPKGRDLRERGWFALHNGVPDSMGTGGEFSCAGTAALVEDPELRSIAARGASYAPADRYVLFELSVIEARCGGYGDVPLPSPTRWAEP
jgi:hypothetical protein